MRFTKQERTGMICWITIMTILVTTPKILDSMLCRNGAAPKIIVQKVPLHPLDADKVRTMEGQDSLNAFKGTSAKSDRKAPGKTRTGHRIVRTENPPGDTIPDKRPGLSIRRFDPNHTSEEVLLEMGMPVFFTKNLVKYCQAGGRIYSAEDIRKIYGMTPELFERIKDSIIIKDGSDPKAESIINLNTADQPTLEALPGIGPVLSTRIIKFRDKLGGFTHVAQLGETYGLPEETFERLKARFYVQGEVQALDINNSDKNTLANHPYISWREAEAIIHYRSQHGPFSRKEEIRKCALFEAENLERLYPYLRVGSGVHDTIARTMK